MFLLTDCQLRVSGPDDPVFTFEVSASRLSSAALVDCEHLAMILEQASDGVQRLCVPFHSGPYGDCVDLRLSGARGFVCSEGMMMMTSRPDTQSVTLLAYLFASISFFPESVPGNASAL